MDTPGAELPKSRLWTANYTRAWVANFLLFFSFMVMTPLFPVYLSSEFGADKDTIGWVLAGYSITAVLARFVSGWLVDSFPRMVVLVVSYLLFTVCTGVYLLAGSLLAFAVVRTLHGAPFGATTVPNSTVAVDSLPFSRRAEGIGFYGVSNNVVSALAPSVGLAMYGAWADFDLLMWVAVVLAVLGLLVNSTTGEPLSFSLTLFQNVGNVGFFDEAMLALMLEQTRFIITNEVEGLPTWAAEFKGADVSEYVVSDSSYYTVSGTDVVFVGSIAVNGNLIPEPTTATLGLLALTSLLARRRRK